MKQSLEISEERKELKEKYQLLKGEYVQLMTDKDMLLDFGKSQLEALYVVKIGKKQLELLEMSLVVKGLKRQFELAMAYVNRNEKINWHTIDLEVNIFLTEDYKKLIAESERIENANKLLSNLASPERSVELRRLYRQLAKELHPDVNQNLTVQQQNLLHAVRRAYEYGDLESLRALAVVVNDSERNTEIISDDDLKTQIELIKAGIEKLHSEIEVIRSTFPFIIEKELRNEEWVAEQNRKTEQQLEELLLQNRKYEERIEILKSL
jgi:hypothetical protein